MFLAITSYLVKVSCIIVTAQHGNVFVVCIFVVNTLRPFFRTIGHKVFDDLIISKLLVVSEVLIRFFDLICKRFTEIRPQCTVLTVVYVCSIKCVYIFVVIVKHQTTFVIDTKAGVVIIEPRLPLTCCCPIGQEHILGSLVYHEHYRSINVIDQ